MFYRWWPLVSVLLAWLFLSSVPAQPTDAADTGRPRLAVLVYFDQLRGDFLTRWDSLFVEGGFHRLEGEGVWFQNCHYPYALTVTGAGHASVATGCSPRKHGIVGNEWYDRDANTAVNCVSADGASGDRFQRVPPPPEPSGEILKKRAKGYSPDRLLTPTLADAVKQATNGHGRVVSLSFKDRSAILPGGRRPDVCCWLDGETGTFVTSRYYRERLPAWVSEFNAARPADR